jgi:hypothetical protein
MPPYLAPAILSKMSEVFIFRSSVKKRELLLQAFTDDFFRGMEAFVEGRHEDPAGNGTKADS